MKKTILMIAVSVLLGAGTAKAGTALDGLMSLGGGREMEMPSFLAPEPAGSAPEMGCAAAAVRGTHETNMLVAAALLDQIDKTKDRNAATVQVVEIVSFAIKYNCDKELKTFIINGIYKRMQPCVEAFKADCMNNIMRIADVSSPEVKTEILKLVVEQLSAAQAGEVYYKETLKKHMFKLNNELGNGGC